MNEINVTVNLSTEDRKRLDAILDALTASRNCERCASTVANAISDFAGAPGTAQKPAEPAPASQEAKAPEQPKPAQPKPQKEVTLSEIQALTAQAIAAGKKAQAREIITRYADSISGLPKSCLAEVQEQLIALREEG
jgi:hypothetical protein